jgi:hypothetical protein
MARALELQAEIAEKTCTSIIAIEEEITSRVRRVPPYSEQTVACLLLGLRETEGSRPSLKKLGPSPSDGKRGMGYDFSSKFIAATRRTARISFLAQGQVAWPDDRANSEGPKRMPLCHRCECQYLPAHAGGGSPKCARSTRNYSSHDSQ